MRQVSYWNFVQKVVFSLLSAQTHSSAKTKKLKTAVFIVVKDNKELKVENIFF